MSFQKYLLFLFFFISISHQRLINYSIPQKESFNLIKSGEKTLIELTPTCNEIFYYFDNQFESSDIIITLKSGHQYTTRMYLYDNYDNIDINENGDYINYIEEIDLSEKFSYINNTQKCIYYIIIKDLGSFPANDYITIYNSKDTLELKQDEPFTIKMFFENNLYKFSFNGEDNDIIELDLNINNITFEQNVDIYKDDIQIYNENINKGIIVLNKDKKKGNYILNIKSVNNEIYKEIDSSIIIRKNKFKVNNIEPEQEKDIFYSNSMDIYFYLNLDNYQQKEEGIITFEVSHNAYKNNFIDYCYSKNMNFDTFNDDIFMNNMPSESKDSISNFTRLNSLQTIYHLYFVKDKKNEEGKKSFLLVHCNLIINEYLEPEKIAIIPSKKPKVIDLTNKDIINEKIRIQSYIPIIYKIKIPANENIKSYVFYTKYKIQTVYENSMLNKDYNNEELVKIYAISKTDLKKEKDNYKIIYIKLFGGNQELNFRVESTNSEIYITNSLYRNNITFSKENLNNETSFYFIGSYSYLATNVDNYYLEEIYGKFDIYYKNEISENDESILTNGNNKYLINSKIGDLTNFIDILEIKCKEQGYYNLHILRQYSSSRSFIVYERQLFIVPKGNIYITPIKNKEQKEINFEISTPLGKEVEIINDNKIINNENRYYQIQYEDIIPEQIRLKIKEDYTLINILITDKDLYQIIYSSSDIINKENILIKLPNNNNYTKVNITLTGKINSYICTLFKGDINYAFSLKSSGYEMISTQGRDKINIVLSNPYTKSNIIISDKPESPFYVAFYIEASELKNKKIDIIYDNGNSEPDNTKDDDDNDNTSLIVIGIIIPLIIILGIIAFIIVKKQNNSKVDQDLPEENTGLIGNF